MDAGQWRTENEAAQAATAVSASNDHVAGVSTRPRDEGAHHFFVWNGGSPVAASPPSAPVSREYHRCCLPAMCVVFLIFFR